MAVVFSKIIDKYQGVAPKQVIRAVEKAAARTGADFSFLMEKASTESSFNPAAKSKTSSATGLFQFIESTWLTMVKEHGAKYGLGKFADQIEVKNGKPCVSDCNVKDAILNLRKNPEISALMAGEFSAQNKEYLEARVDGDVGAPELYLAHFMGAGGAAKFLNKRDENGDMSAAALFPKEARANRNVFFDKSGEARSLNEVYDFFSKKMNGGTSPSAPSAPSPCTQAEARPATSAPAQPSSSASEIAQALLSSTMNETPVVDDIIWDAPRPHTSTGFVSSRAPALHNLSAENILLMAQMQERMPHMDRPKPAYNS